MYSLLENYIRLVFENEQKKPRSFEEVLDDVSKDNEEKKEKPEVMPKKKSNFQIEADPYYWLRPGYRKSSQTR